MAAQIIINDSSEKATLLIPELVGKVALAVTSPPYHNAISYTSHEADPNANYRTREHIDYGEEYLALLDRVWDQCWLMLRPGGHLAVNVGTVLEDGYQYPLPQDIEASLMTSSRNWKFMRSIIWHKVTAGVKRAGSVIQHRLPGYWYPNIMTEHIIVVRKPGKSVIDRKTPSEWWDTVWDLAPVPPKVIDHPAPFPEEIPHRLTRMLTRSGDWVLDPFNGAGATTAAAVHLGRKGLGFDISKTYVEIAEQRCLDDSRVRPAQLQIAPVQARDFTPKPMKGSTRHGAGINARGRRNL